MKVRLDREKCTGHGRCYALSPELFEPDEEGNGVLLNHDEIPPEHEAAARRAAMNCPEHAIEVIE